MRLALPTVLAIALLPVDADGQGRRGRKHEPVDLKHFTYEVKEFEAPSMGGALGEIGVYVPASVADDDETVLPWVLWLHGINEDASRFHDGGGANAIDRLLGDGAIPPMIVVAPTAPRRTIYANGEHAGDIEDYILKDVVSYVEEHYPVSKERDQRALMGVSMGGMASLRIALNTPELFGTVAVHSAAAFPVDPTVLTGRTAERVHRSIQWLGLSELLGDPIDPEKWKRFIPSGIASELSPEDLKGLRIYVDAGTDDRYGFGPPNEQFHELLVDRGIEHEFTLVEGGGHSWGSGTIQKQLVHSFGFVAEGFGHEAAAQSAEAERESEDG